MLRGITVMPAQRYKGHFSLDFALKRPNTFPRAAWREVPICSFASRRLSGLSGSMLLILKKYANLDELFTAISCQFTSATCLASIDQIICFLFGQRLYSEHPNNLQKSIII